jgi:hypothetical protein
MKRVKPTYQVQAIVEVLDTDVAGNKSFDTAVNIYQSPRHNTPEFSTQFSTTLL